MALSRGGMRIRATRRWWHGRRLSRRQASRIGRGWRREGGGAGERGACHLTVLWVSRERERDRGWEGLRCHGMRPASSGEQCVKAYRRRSIESQGGMQGGRRYTIGSRASRVATHCAGKQRLGWRKRGPVAGWHANTCYETMVAWQEAIAQAGVAYRPGLATRGRRRGLRGACHLEPYSRLLGRLGRTPKPSREAGMAKTCEENLLTGAIWASFGVEKAHHGN